MVCFLAALALIALPSDSTEMQRPVSQRPPTQGQVAKRPVPRAGYRIAADLYLPPFGQVQSPYQYTLLNGQQLPGAPRFIFGENNQIVGVIPANLPPYLQAMNCGIPGVCATPKFNILKYGSLQWRRPGQPLITQAAFPGGLGGMGFPGGGGGGSGAPGGGFPGGGSNGGSGTPYSGGSGGSGSSSGSGGSYNTGNNGGWYNSGPDSLCQGNKGSFQTKIGNGLTNDLSLCDVIYNTITDSCTGEFADQLGQQETKDMEDFCPGWNSIKNNREKRAIALMNLVAAIVKTESSWKNGTVGDGGKSKGLLQLTVATDRKHGCSCEKLVDEFDAAQNLSCGTQMIVSFMAKDGTVGEGTGEHCGRGCGAQGIARSFGPFRDGRKEREDIKRRISEWCRSSLQNATPPNSSETPPAAR